MDARKYGIYIYIYTSGPFGNFTHLPSYLHGFSWKAVVKARHHGRCCVRPTLVVLFVCLFETTTEFMLRKVLGFVVAFSRIFHQLETKTPKTFKDCGPFLGGPVLSRVERVCFSLTLIKGMVVVKILFVLRVSTRVISRLSTYFGLELLMRIYSYRFMGPLIQWIDRNMKWMKPEATRLTAAHKWAVF